MESDYKMTIKHMAISENTVTVIVSVGLKGSLFGEILTLNVNVDKMEGKSLAYYESKATDEAKKGLKNIASQL